jgi:Ca2+-binding RTX toxin-like protein
VLTGTGAANATLTCRTGTWPAGAVVTFQWLRSGTPMPLVVAPNYTLTAADGGTTISCRVSARNVGGTTTVETNGVLVATTATPGGGAKPPAPDLCDNLFGVQAAVPFGFTRSGSACAGTSGRNTLVGTTGLDVVNGFDGNDLIYGYAGNDRLYGGAGNDHVDGGAGVDKVDGGSGNDTLIGGAGKDRLVGGPGRDNIDAFDHAGGDVVVCGRGYDSVHADKKDVVGKDCERKRVTK